MLDARMISGPMQVAVGLLPLVLAFRLWLIRPTNMVLRLGPFITRRGITAIYSLRLSLFAWGSALFVSGLNSMIFWFGRRDVFDPLVQTLGSMGAGLWLFAAAMTALSAWRLWRLNP